MPRIRITPFNNLYLQAVRFAIKEIGYEVFVEFEAELKWTTGQENRIADCSIVAYVNPGSFSGPEYMYHSDKIEIKARCVLDAKHHKNGVPAVDVTICCLQAVGLEADEGCEAAHFEVRVARLRVNLSHFMSPTALALPLEESDSELLARWKFQTVKRAKEVGDKIEVMVIRC